MLRLQKIKNKKTIEYGSNKLFSREQMWQIMWKKGKFCDHKSIVMIRFSKNMYKMEFKYRKSPSITWMK